MGKQRNYTPAFLPLKQDASGLRICKGSSQTVHQRDSQTHKDTICRLQAQPMSMGRTLQHQKLMAQGQNLSLQGSAGAQRASQGIKEEPEEGQHENRAAYRLRMVNSMKSVHTEFSVWTGGFCG